MGGTARCMDLRAAEARLRAQLTRRISLGPWPTPVHELTALARRLDARARLFVKRDDLATFGMGGSKVRKLEILAAQACEAGADLLVTSGGVQSNCARLTATIAARLGMRCAIVMNGRADMPVSGNLRACTDLRAQVTFVAEPGDRAEAVAGIIARAQHDGHRPFEIPISAATPLSAFAMTAAMLETLDAHPAPDVVIVCSSSGATQAGLLLGAVIRGVPLRILGVSPDDPAAAIVPRIRGLLGVMANHIDLPRQAIERLSIEVEDGFAAGSACERAGACERALELASHTEGMFLDPNYTCRTVAALVDAIRRDRFPSARSILFWHTGGLPSLLSR